MSGTLTLGGLSAGVAGVGLLLVADLTAYLVAGARAQAAADAAALAAVAVSDVRGGRVGDPRAEAAAVARAGGAEVRACDCDRGDAVVEVTVAVPVRAIAITRFAATTALATARAHLVPPDAPLDLRPFAGREPPAGVRSPARSR